MLLDIIKKPKKSFKKDARERYQNLSRENKNEKRQYALERYRNLS